MEQDNNKYLTIESKFKYVIFVIIRTLLLPLCRLLYGSKRKWLICERGDDAQDNGFIFYDFLIRNHKEIHPIFLIKKDSPDYLKVAKLGRIALFGSIKHFLMCIGCRVKISSNLYGYAPWIVMEKFFRRNKTKDIHVFLQHGIVKNYHDSFHSKNNKSLSLFVSGARPEFDYLVKSLGYPNGVIQYTGLPRFDNLFDCSGGSNVILIMPTWRTYLKGSNFEDFKNSDFYKKWISLLQDEKFTSLASKNGIKIYLYLHHELQEYLPLFTNLKHIILISYTDNTVQQLLIDSRLLITDYSSVYFDFAYMYKNVLFYQFDENDYYNKHYARGYFDYRKANLGNVFTSKNELIDNVSVILSKNYILDEERIRSIDYYFPVRDKNNSERVFESIMNLLGFPEHPKH